MMQSVTFSSALSCVDNPKSECLPERIGIYVGCDPCLDVCHASVVCTLDYGVDKTCSVQYPAYVVLDTDLVDFERGGMLSRKVSVATVVEQQVAIPVVIGSGRENLTTGCVLSDCHGR